MRPARVTVTVAPGDGGVVHRVRDDLWRVSCGDVTFEGERDALDAWVANIARQFESAPADREGQLQRPWSDVTPGDTVHLGDGGHLVSEVYPADGAGRRMEVVFAGRPGTTAVWPRHHVWVTPGTGCVSWSDDLTWHDVEVGDLVRLEGEWRSVTTIRRKSLTRPGCHVVFIDPAIGFHRCVYVDPTDPVKVQFPRIRDAAVAS